MLRLQSFSTGPHSNGEVRFGIGPLCVLAALVGVVTGFGALIFRVMISLVHNLFFLKTVSLSYDSSLFTPANPWGVFVILVPVAGAIIVTFIVANFAPEAKGHGVPEVMAAIYYSGGVIRPVVAAVKSIASAVAIGSGAAVGREGPIIQIGSALGSTFGQIIRLDAGQRITLVAAGAGAGIAATFNTPHGGVLFVTELMLPEVSVNTFLPVATATGIATFVGRLFFGSAPAFAVPVITPLPNELGAGAFTLLLYVVLCPLMGVAAAVFVRGLHLMEDVFDRIPGRYLRHMLGMLIVGALIYALFEFFGHYYVEGVGYATIQAILDGQLTSGGLLALLYGCKVAATSISLGSGSSGGVFSPSLFMGATMGGAFAAALAQFGIPVSIPAFAMVGMAKLTRRGQPVPRGLHANMFLVQKAKDVMETEVPMLEADARLDEFLARPENEQALRHVVVTKDGRVFGVLRINTRLRHRSTQGDRSVNFGEVAQRNFTIVRETTAMFDVITRMSRHDAAMALVISTDAARAVPRPSRIRGVITKEHIADSVARTVKMYPG